MHKKIKKEWKSEHFQLILGCLVINTFWQRSSDAISTHIGKKSADKFIHVLNNLIFFFLFWENKVKLDILKWFTDMTSEKRHYKIARKKKKKGKHHLKYFHFSIGTTISVKKKISENRQSFFSFSKN